MSDICLGCSQSYPPNGILFCDDCGMDKDIEQQKEREMTEVETSQFWTQVKGEGEVVRTFAKIPEGYTGKLSDLSGDDEVFFWLTPEEWIGLGAGSQYGDVDVLSCACEECESERYAEYWVGEYE